MSRPMPAYVVAYEYINTEPDDASMWIDDYHECNTMHEVTEFINYCVEQNYSHQLLTDEQRDGLFAPLSGYGGYGSTADLPF